MLKPKVSVTLWLGGAQVTGSSKGLVIIEAGKHAEIVVPLKELRRLADEAEKIAEGK
jgi:hypothetical protein